MHAKITIFALISAAISLVGVIRQNAPPIVLPGVLSIEAAKGHSEMSCNYMRFSYTDQATCLSDLSEAPDAVAAAKEYYLDRIDASGWKEITASAHEDTVAPTKKMLLSKESGRNCQFELAVDFQRDATNSFSVMSFEAYLVKCWDPDLQALFKTETETVEETK